MFVKMLVLQPMKKIVFLFLIIPFFAFSQERIILKGNVFDGVTFFPIEGANIYNFSSKKYSFTNKEGNFEIFTRKNDTIIISKPAYQQAFVVVTQEMIERNRFEISLFFKAIILKEVNVYALPPTYDAFKKEFANTNFTEFYKRIGGTTLTQQDIVNTNYSPDKGANLLNFLPKAVSSPISYLYDKYSRKKKMERLFYELVENQEEIENLPKKYNRDLVTSLTGLEGEELLDFMTFCKFSYYDLVKWSPEYIISQIKKKHGDYEFYKAIEDN